MRFCFIIKQIIVFLILISHFIILLNKKPVTITFCLKTYLVRHIDNDNKVSVESRH